MGWIWIGFFWIIGLSEFITLKLKSGLSESEIHRFDQATQYSYDALYDLRHYPHTILIDCVIFRNWTFFCDQFTKWKFAVTWSLTKKCACVSCVTEFRFESPINISKLNIISAIACRVETEFEKITYRPFKAPFVRNRWRHPWANYTVWRSPYPSQITILRQKFYFVTSENNYQIVAHKLCDLTKVFLSKLMSLIKWCCFLNQFTKVTLTTRGKLDWGHFTLIIYLFFNFFPWFDV